MMIHLETPLDSSRKLGGHEVGPSPANETEDVSGRCQGADGRRSAALWRTIMDCSLLFIRLFVFITIKKAVNVNLLTVADPALVRLSWGWWHLGLKGLHTLVWYFHLDKFWGTDPIITRLLPTSTKEAHPRSTPSVLTLCICPVLLLWKVTVDQRPREQFC